MILGFCSVASGAGPCDALAATPPNPPQDRYAVIAWNDLGMHCMDTDYSVFAILPPYNNLHAQLIDRQTGKTVTSKVMLYYQATPDTQGSINTTSIAKTNFWDYSGDLFGVVLKPDFGLAGNPVQSRKPAPLAYDPAGGLWKANGIPTIPYDDKGDANRYPMVKVTATDRKGKVLAITKTVLPVSDELACSHCHASGTGDPAAKPSPDWVNDPEPAKDWKRNILLLHDNRNLADPACAPALAQNHYDSAGLLATSDAGTSVLCANCHSSNALGTKGVGNIKQLSTSIHSWHAVKAMDDNTGMPLGQTMDRTGCYYCHPGSTTLCLRGAMGIAKYPDGSLKLECQSCHGSMNQVGAPDRKAWVDLPQCQDCHYQAADGKYVRDTSALDANGNFKNMPSIFSSGGALYKLAATHGTMQCESCHGSTHAEYATANANDNVQSILLQKHTGMVSECTVCHQNDQRVTHNGGPHGLHSIGQVYISSHGKAAKSGAAACSVCHGADYRGTSLSKTFAARKFLLNSPIHKTRYDQGQLVSCYDCHNGPAGMRRR